MPDDITEEELDNVADRAKDKILDKENVSRWFRHVGFYFMTPYLSDVTTTGIRLVAL